MQLSLAAHNASGALCQASLPPGRSPHLGVHTRTHRRAAAAVDGGSTQHCSSSSSAHVDRRSLGLAAGTSVLVALVRAACGRRRCPQACGSAAGRLVRWPPGGHLPSSRRQRAHWGPGPRRRPPCPSACQSSLPRRRSPFSFPGVCVELYIWWSHLWQADEVWTIGPPLHIVTLQASCDVFTSAASVRTQEDAGPVPGGAAHALGV